MRVCVHSFTICCHTTLIHTQTHTHTHTHKQTNTLISAHNTRKLYVRTCTLSQQPVARRWGKWHVRTCLYFPSYIACFMVYFAINKSMLGVNIPYSWDLWLVEGGRPMASRQKDGIIEARYFYYILIILKGLVSWSRLLWPFSIPQHVDETSKFFFKLHSTIKYPSVADGCCVRLPLI